MAGASKQKDDRHHVAQDHDDDANGASNSATDKSLAGHSGLSNLITSLLAGPTGHQFQPVTGYGQSNHCFDSTNSNGINDNANTSTKLLLGVITLDIIYTISKYLPIYLICLAFIFMCLVAQKNGIKRCKLSVKQSNKKNYYLSHNYEMNDSSKSETSENHLQTKNFNNFLK